MAPLVGTLHHNYSKPHTYIVVPPSGPGTKKDAGTAIWPKKQSPGGLLRVQEGFILREAADFSGLDQPIFLKFGVI